ncbi:ABC transporter substrate-binding protein [Frankia sp. R82]|uniref:ABC transporter substrate-binding protein n=1 Tax=Frankia sp. R82 TaxID=2950553 RepID=UPI0020442F9A|nr:ABC transporter substrate-binding protein [Frankia sp. R82]MCM3884756.1 ABC transporter substrate-binding protein [Frankia sp. R82]
MAAAACSSSGSSGGGSSTASGSPIKIGAICTCTGTFNIKAPADTYKAWVESTNAAGGINGHPIDLTLLDDGGTPGKSATAARTLISKKVVAIVDLTNVDQTWSKLVEDAKIPVVGVQVTTTPSYTSPYFFPEGLTENSLFTGVIKSAQQASAKSFGIFYCAEAVQCQEGLEPLKKVGEGLGLPVSYAAEISATAPNYTAQCIAARDKKIEALFIAHTAGVAEKVAANCNQQNYHPTYVVSGDTISTRYETLAGLKDNLVGPASSVPYFLNTPALQAMNTAVDKYVPGLRDDKTLYNQSAPLGWLSGKLFGAAAKAGGLGANGSTPTSEQLLKGLYALKDETLDGQAAPLTYTAGSGHQVNCWFEISVRGGKLGAPNDTKPTCATSS